MCRLTYIDICNYARDPSSFSQNLPVVSPLWSVTIVTIQINSHYWLDYCYNWQNMMFYMNSQIYKISLAIKHLVLLKIWCAGTIARQSNSWMWPQAKPEITYRLFTIHFLCAWQLDEEYSSPQFLPSTFPLPQKPHTSFGAVIGHVRM